MPDNLEIALFVLGAILLLIALLGGNFKLFGAEITTGVLNSYTRSLSFFLSIVCFGIIIFMLNKKDVINSTSASNTKPKVNMPNSISITSKSNNPIKHNSGKSGLTITEKIPDKKIPELNKENTVKVSKIVELTIHVNINQSEEKIYINDEEVPLKPTSSSLIKKIDLEANKYYNIRVGECKSYLHITADAQISPCNL